MGLEFFVPKNPALPCASSGGFLTTSQNLDKTNVPIQENVQMGKSMEIWTEGQTLIHRTLSIIVGGSIKTAAMLGPATLNRLV